MWSIMSENVVIDANVLIEGNYLSMPFEKMFTTPEVTEEIKDEMSKFRFDVEDIRIEEPDEKYVDKVSKEREKMEKDVSDADVSVLALALQKNLKVITDDFAMQDLAEKLSIEYEGFLVDRHHS